MKILAILTCFNRKEKTINAIETLVKNNKNIEFEFLVVDDGSTDGTADAIYDLNTIYHITLLEETGNLYYSGGMRKGMNYALSSLNTNYDYLLMINDDVEFFDNSVRKMIEQSISQNAVIVGTTCNQYGQLTYGAIKYIRNNKYITLDISDWNTPADSFNANCVLIPYSVFAKCGPIDSYYIHSLGDFDYGLLIKRNKHFIYPSKEYCGCCERNSTKNSWLDTNLSRKNRIRLKEKPKGQPTKQWFYFLKKNFGIMVAIKGCITPYIRILFKK